MSHNSTTRGDVNIFWGGLGIGAFILVMILLLGYLLGEARRDCMPCLCVPGDDARVHGAEGPFQQAGEGPGYGALGDGANPAT